MKKTERERKERRGFVPFVNVTFKAAKKRREDEEQQQFAKELDEAERGIEFIATLKSRIREAKLQLEEAPNEIKEQDRLLEEAEREYNGLRERIKTFKDV